MPKHTQHAENYEINITRKAVAEQVTALLNIPKRRAWNRSNSLNLFRKQLVALRKKMGLSQSVIAKLVGVSQARYNVIESGRGNCYNISLETACRIADVFHCSVSLLLVSYQDHIVSINTKNMPFPHPYALDYSQCESEIPELEEALRLGRRQLVTMGNLNDGIGIKEKLLTEAERRRLAVDTTNIYKSDIGEGE